MLCLDLVSAQGSVDFIEQTQALDVDRLLRADAEVPGAEDEVEVLARVELVPLETSAERMSGRANYLKQAENKATEDDEEVRDGGLVVARVVLPIVTIVENCVLQYSIAHEEVQQTLLDHPKEVASCGGWPAETLLPVVLVLHLPLLRAAGFCLIDWEPDAKGGIFWHCWGVVTR